MTAQNLWRWCRNCQGLHWRGQSAGYCVLGTGHDATGSGDYTLWYGGSTLFLSFFQICFENSSKVTNSVLFSGSGGSSQNGWRWCRRCQHLFYGGLGNGVCPLGGPHDPMGSGDYWLRHNDYSAPGQPGWRWCRKCQILFYNGNGQFGICPTGGGHDPTGSGAYTLMHVPMY
jgi:hypothetical protein